MKHAAVALASANEGKIRELTELLKPFAIEVIGLGKWPNLRDIPETGSTFAENALIKARTVAMATGLPAIADDSGLVVDALGGRPGVYSARFADDWPALPGETRDEKNIRKLLSLMASIPQNERGAHFETAMAAALPNGRELVASGVWQGEILFAPRGRNGFGYDPVFFDRSLNKTGAELLRDQKNAVSHRGKALRALAAHFKDLFN